MLPDKDDAGPASAPATAGRKAGRRQTGRRIGRSDVPESAEEVVVGTEVPDGGGVVAMIDGIAIEDATDGVTEPDMPDPPAAGDSTITSSLIYGLRAPGALVWVLIAAKGVPGREELWCRVHNFDQTTEELRVSVNTDCKV